MAIKMCNGHSDHKDYTLNSPCNNSETTYESAVLDMYEENGYNDSDFLAVVWDDTLNRPITRVYASTRGWTYHNGARIDATQEILDKALAWYRGKWIEWAIKKAHQDAQTPKKGSTIRSLTTKGKAVGAEGVVKWIGVDSYRSTRYTTMYRVGIKVEGNPKLVYLPLEKAEVLNPDHVDIDEIRELGKTVTPANWRSALYQF
jgi:hypothetical protein